MNNTNSPADNEAADFPPELIVFLVLQQLIFVVACTGNATVIFIFVRFLKMNSNTSKLIVNLAVSDFISGISAGIQIFYVFYPDLSSTKALCFTRYMMLGFSSEVSQFMVAIVTLDRYIAICHPYKYHTLMSKKIAIALCVLSWFLVFVYHTIAFTSWSEWNHGDECIYQKLFTPEYYLIGSLIIFILSTIPFVLYIFIFRTAWPYYNRRKLSMKRNQQFKQNVQLERDIRTFKVMAIVTIMSTVGWLPYQAFAFRNGLRIDNSSSELTQISKWLVFLGLLNCVMNPFIYAWKRPDFRNGLKKYFCRYKIVKISPSLDELE